MSAVVIVGATHADLMRILTRHEVGAGLFMFTQLDDGVSIDGPNSDHTQMALLTLEQKAREDGWTVRRT